MAALYTLYEFDWFDFSQLVAKQQTNKHESWKQSASVQLQTKNTFQELIIVSL